MATKRRRPGVLPQSLTPEQRATARRCFPIGVSVAMYFARQHPPGLAEDDLLGAADEAVTLAVTTYSEPKVPVEVYVWARVRSTIKTLIRQTAERLGLRAPNDTPEARMADAGGEALLEHALNVEDPCNIWRDTPEQQVEQYDALAHDGATALDLGGGGHLWHTRGEVGFVLRIEYLRANKTLHDEVARLRPDIATVVHLRFFEELPIEEVARQAGVSEKTVTRMIAKAIPILRARLRAQEIDDLSFLDGR